MGIRILRNEDIDYMLSIVESNLPDKEKAKILYSFCNFKTINDTLERENVDRKNDLERLKKIYRIYDGNDYLPLSKKRYKCTVEDIELRVDKLAKAREIVLSSVKDYKKVEKLLILYKDLEDFRRQYSLFQRYGKEDKNLDLFRETLDSIDMVYSKLKEYEENGLIDNIKFINDNSQLINNYENAKKIINHYIDDPDSYNHENFFASLSIDKEKFIFCLNTIKAFDSNLYKKYQEKKELNKKVRYVKSKETIIDLVIAIKTGSFKDGTPFDLLEFVKKVPFKYDHDFFDSITEFMKRNCTKEEYFIMTKYLYDNKFKNKKVFEPLNLNTVYNTKTIIKGRELTREDKDTIIEYLKVNSIPVISKTYYVAKFKYVDGKITKELVEQEKAKKFVKQI